MKFHGNLPVLAAVATVALLAAGCQKSTTGSASAPTADSGGMANSDSSAMNGNPNNPNNPNSPPDSNPTAATPAAAPALSDDARNFMTKAATGGLFEVDAAQLAESRTSNAKVKSFAQRMVTDHTNADNQLASIAQKDQFTLPTSLPADEQSQLDHLKSLNGRAFDRAYAEMMVKDHQQDVQEFQQAASNLSDPDLRTFAQTTLPTLQTHLSLAESLPGEHGRMQASAASGNRRSNQ